MPVEPGALADAFPDATSRVVVFVHGLGETGAAWGWRGARRYGERLQDELSFTPVYLRYNTGLHISRNGRELARLLEALLAGWPCRRRGARAGRPLDGRAGRPQRLPLRRGRGAALDGRRAPRVLPRHAAPGRGPREGRQRRSAGRSRGCRRRAGSPRSGTPAASGIKDLRYGACIDEDWLDCDPDEFLRDRCREVPFLPDANYYFIGAALSGPVGSLVGDLLVRMPSSTGRGTGKGRRIPFEVDNGRELPGLTHFDLLNHPDVYEQIRTWITRTPVRR